MKTLNGYFLSFHRVGNLKLYMSIISHSFTERSVKSNKAEKNGKITTSRDSDSKSKYRMRALRFSDSKKIPIFHCDKCTCTTGEIVKILWSATNNLFKCREPPTKAQKNGAS